MFKKKPEVQTDEDDFEEEIEEMDETDVEEEMPKPVEKKSTDKMDLITPTLWKVEEIPTDTRRVIYNSKEKKVYELDEAIAELLNRFDKA